MLQRWFGVAAFAVAFAAQVSFYQLPSGAFPHDVAPAGILRPHVAQLFAAAVRLLSHNAR